MIKKREGKKEEEMSVLLAVACVSNGLFINTKKQDECVSLLLIDITTILVLKIGFTYKTWQWDCMIIKRFILNYFKKKN